MVNTHNISISCLLILLCIFLSCKQETLEQRAQREAKDFTERECPTPWVNDTSIDSLTFSIEKKAFYYHYSFRNNLENKRIIDSLKANLHGELVKSIANETRSKTYKDAGYSFIYIAHAKSNPSKIVYKDTIKAEEYNKMLTPAKKKEHNRLHRR